MFQNTTHEEEKKKFKKKINKIISILKIRFWFFLVFIFSRGQKKERYYDDIL